MSNTVEVTGTQQVLVTETAAQVVELQVPTAPAVVEIATEGPQGAAGDATGLPTGGDPGNVLLKSSYANYESEWSPVVDGGTFA